MKLRSHLAVLVLAAVLPVLAFSAVMGVVFWRQQRAAYDQRYLERVRALAIALDRELDGHLRALQVLGESIALQRGDLPTFYEQAKRVKAQQPAWATVALADTEGAQVFNLRRPFGTSLPRTGLGDELVRQIVTTSRPAISSLFIGTVSGAHATAVAVPVRRADTVTHVLIVVLEPHAWLELFARYPLVPGATMTLLDQRGVIVARTLNHDRWVGTLPAPGLTRDVGRAPEGAYRNHGLVGQLFYAAQMKGIELSTASACHIVELHGGTVRAASDAEGRGASFTVALPLSPAVRSGATLPGHQAVAAATVPVPEVSLDGVRVLLVDDDRDAGQAWTERPRIR